ncbi:MAG: hypothetical protein AAFW84_06925 [Cyanobacteria bacterium J06635_15]
MSQPHRSAKDRHPLEQYEICIKGHLDHRWSDWFEGFAIALKDNGETLLSGSVIDQAALYGVLIKVRDLGLPLISVMPVQPTQTEIADKQTGEQP